MPLPHYPASDQEEPDGDEAPKQAPDEDPKYATAGRAIRHAIADQDDAGLAQAICDLIDIHTGGSDEEEESPAKGKKPNLALLLMGKKK